MRQQEFIDLSKERIKKLNGSTNKLAAQCWRDGYIHAMNEIKKSFENDFNEEFMEKTEEFINQNIEVFE